MMYWKPIESAPRDGTWFVGRKFGVELLTQWGKTSHVPLYGWCFVLSDYGDPDYDIWQPNEWRPLPTGIQLVQPGNKS
jgi:hypothetical protein